MPRVIDDPAEDCGPRDGHGDDGGGDGGAEGQHGPAGSRTGLGDLGQVRGSRGLHLGRVLDGRRSERAGPRGQCVAGHPKTRTVRNVRRLHHFAGWRDVAVGAQLVARGVLDGVVRLVRLEVTVRRLAELVLSVVLATQGDRNRKTRQPQGVIRRQVRHDDGGRRAACSQDRQRNL